MHLCPLQFDIVDRLIDRYTNTGEIVFDPFSGLGTVAMRALERGRVGVGCELAETYHRDAISYLRSAEERIAVPTLFDLVPAHVADAEVPA
jgi:DNA modification methylase